MQDHYLITKPGLTYVFYAGNHRTFPLISLMGCTGAMISQLFISWTFAAAFVTLAALIITAHVLAYPSRKGITTEIAAFLFGGLVWCQMTPLAAALSFVTVLPDRTFGPLEVLNPYKYGELCL